MYRLNADYLVFGEALIQDEKVHVLSFRIVVPTDNLQHAIRSLILTVCFVFFIVAILVRALC